MTEEAVPGPKNFPRKATYSLHSLALLTVWIPPALQEDIYLGGLLQQTRVHNRAFLDGSLYSLSGMTVFDFQDQSWTNISTLGYSQSGWGVFGAAHFVASFGDEGILVFIGGDSPPVQSYSFGSSRRSMDEITIFDVYNHKWYHQLASGDVPAPRVRFCISGAQETKAGFYEIFVFAGTTGYEFGPSNVDFHQVYVLTLPAFRWIRAMNSLTASRTAHHCHGIGNRQMLSIGGYDPTSRGEYAIVDPWPYGLGIFDMTALQWTDKYDAAAIAYVQSDQVQTYYSKGSNYPSSWNDPLLEAIFTNSRNDSTTNRNASTTAPTTEAEINQAAQQNSAGLIAGGVLGGIFGLAVFFFVAWLCFKRRDKKKTAASSRGTEYRGAE